MATCTGGMPVPPESTDAHAFHRPRPFGRGHRLHSHADFSEPRTEERTCRRRGHEPEEALQSPLETYLREINATALLSAADEHELAERIGEGDAEARDRMVRANLRLVVNIARGYSGKGLALQDLIEEGNLGLLRAVEGFDPKMGTRFSTYASYWIKQSIKRALINSAKTIRIPAYMVELLSKWRRATTRLNDELGRSPPPKKSPACWDCRRRSCRSSRKPSGSTIPLRRQTKPRRAGRWASWSWTSG